MTFKFSPQTKAIIDNFKNISPAMLFTEGSELRIYNRQVLGIAQITEVIPKEFGVYNLSKLLNIISAFGDHNITFNDQSLTITNSNDDKKYDFRYTPTHMIDEPPTNDVEMNDVLAQFTLSKKDFNELTKIVAISQHLIVDFVGEGGKLFIQSVDTKNNSTDNYQNVVGTTDKTFRVHIKFENLVPLMPENYTVTLTENVCLFDAPSAKVKYYVAPETED